jgi:hypothetical protein
MRYILEATRLPQNDHVTIIHPFVIEPFAYYFFADPDGHVIQVYFDPKAR